MSIKLISWALDVTTGSSTSKLVLIKLADNANDQGRCWPSIAYIAKQTELSERAVREHIRLLEEKGFVETVRRVKEGVNLPNAYVLKFDRTECLSGAPEMASEEVRDDGGVGHDVPEGGAPPAGGVGHHVPPNRHSKPSKKPEEGATRSRSQAIPDNFPTQAERSAAIEYWNKARRPDLVNRLEEIAAQFRDHHLARNSKFASWPAAFRTWVRRSVDYEKPPRGSDLFSAPVAFEQTNLSGWLNRLWIFYGEDPDCPKGTWSPKWGFNPDTPGNRVPPEARTLWESRKRRAS